MRTKRHPQYVKQRPGNEGIESSALNGRRFPQREAVGDLRKENRLYQPAHGGEGGRAFVLYDPQKPVARRHRFLADSSEVIVPLESLMQDEAQVAIGGYSLQRCGADAKVLIQF